jgi:FlgD Ig-like domain
MRTILLGRVLTSAVLALLVQASAATAQSPAPPDRVVFRDPFIARTGSLTVSVIAPADSVVFRPPFVRPDGNIDPTVDRAGDVVLRNPFVGRDGGVLSPNVPEPQGLVRRAPFLSRDGTVTDENVVAPDGVRHREPFVGRDGTVTAVQPGVPRRGLVLQSIVPNPFNPSTQISFRLNRREKVTVKVFDAAGRLVRSLHVGELGPDLHVLRWDGTDNGGRSVASGVYMFRVEAGGEFVSAKAALIK